MVLFITEDVLFVVEAACVMSSVLGARASCFAWLLSEGWVLLHELKPHRVWLMRWILNWPLSCYTVIRTWGRRSVVFVPSHTPWNVHVANGHGQEFYRESKSMLLPIRPDDAQNCFKRKNSTPPCNDARNQTADVWICFDHGLVRDLLLVGRALALVGERTGRNPYIGHDMPLSEMALLFLPG